MAGTVRLLLVAAAAGMLGGCAYPYLPILFYPPAVSVASGAQVTVIVKTEEPNCPQEDDPLPCGDIEGLPVDYLLENVPPGVTPTFDYSLQSESTPGLARLELAADATTRPGSYSIAVHARVQGIVVGTRALRLEVQPTSPQPALTELSSIFAANESSFATITDGTALAWGANQYGELGDGSTVMRSTPVPVAGIAGVAAIAGSSDSLNAKSIARLADGTVRLWGSNYERFVRGGGGPDVLEPRRSNALEQIAAVDVSDEHALAAGADGSVYAWGNNRGGELGDGTRDESLSPILVPGIADVVQVAAGSQFSLARHGDGSVSSWGSNASGQLGREGDPDTDTPAPIPGIEAATWIEAGGQFGLALLDDGTLLAWGSNNHGQLGDGTTEIRPTPVEVVGITDAVAIAAGLDHALALGADGTVWSWGLDGSGQILAGGPDQRPLPAPVPGLSDIVAIAAGKSHSLALSACGQLWSFGSNHSGELGLAYTSGFRDSHVHLVPGTGRPGECAQAALSVRIAGTGVGEIVSPDVELSCRLAHQCFAYETVPVSPGAPITLEAITLDPNTVFAGWSGDCAGDDPVVMVSLDGPGTCIATFDSTQRPLLLSVTAVGGRVTSTAANTTLGPAQIDCPGDCAAVFGLGEVVTLTAAEDPGDGFRGWTGDCAGVEREIAVPMDTSKHCVANFEAFEVSVDASGEGTVTSSTGGLDCTDDTCVFEPQTGAVTLFATPALGWLLSGWGGDCAGSDPSFELAVDADKHCTATFERDATVRFLRIVVSGPGSVQSTPPGIDACRSDCTAVFDIDTTVDLLATPDPGNRVLNWFDDCPSAPGQNANSIFVDTDKQCTVGVVDIDEPEFPVANWFSAPGVPRVGQVTTFNGSESYVFDPDDGSLDPEGILTLEWDFENDGSVDAAGTRAEALIVEHTFSSAGTFTVALRVTGGNAGPNGTADEAFEIRDVTVLPAEGQVWGITLSKAGNGAGTLSTDPLGLLACGPGCAALGPVLFEDGEAFTLIATPVAGSTFAGWSGDCAGGAEIPIVMNAARTCTATFDATEAELQVAVAGSGRVTGTGIDCPGDCSELYAIGTQTTVNAAPDPGWELESWTGCDIESGLDCTVALNAPRAVTAIFQLRQVTLDVVNEGGGTVASSPAGIDCGADCSEVYGFGTPVELTATADPGFQFDGWGLACSGTDPTFDLTMDGDRICRANFSPLPAGFTLTVDRVPAGVAGRVVSLDPPNAIDCGAVCSAVFPPGTTVELGDGGDPGTFFAGWLPGCDVIMAGGQCIVTMDSDREVTAVYE